MHALGARGLVTNLVHTQRISELIGDVHARVQSGCRVLEDHRNDASDAPTCIRTALGDFLTVEEHLALRWHLQAAHDVRGRGLATARFADDTERLSALNAHVNASNRMHLVGAKQRSSTGVEGHLNVFELDDRSFSTHQFSS